MRFSPKAHISKAELAKGLRTLTVEVAFSTTCDTVMGGVILTAFAVHLGASNELIGGLAAITCWEQLLQGPAVLLIERLRRRKLIAVIGSLISSLAPAVMTVVAFASMSRDARGGLILAVAIYGAAGAFAGCAWNGWMRDIVPGDQRGRFFSRRSTLSTAVSLCAGLIAATLLDKAPEGSTVRSMVFAGLFIVGALAQLLSATALSTAPEPAMPAAPAHPERLIPLLARPLGDPKFRALMSFLASWQFAVNLAQPFFTVFFLRQLGLGMTAVMGLSLISQLANLLTMRTWGALLDRFHAKSVLNLAAPTFILCIAAMVGASQFGEKVWVVTYLVALHLLMGAAAAGVALGSQNITMKLSPRGSAQVYLATNALVTAAAAGIAPVLGGLCADIFAARKFALSLEWAGPHFQGELLHLSIRAWDFYFVLSALLGLYALHRLAMVREEGELGRRQLVREVLDQALHGRRSVSVEGGMRPTGEVPAEVISSAPPP